MKTNIQKNKYFLSLFLFFYFLTSLSFAKPASIIDYSAFIPSSTYYEPSDFSGQSFPQMSEFIPCVDLKHNMKPGTRDFTIFGPVTVLQMYLYQNEYMIYPPTGNYLNYTFQGVLAFQASHDLRTTGTIDVPTRAALKEETCKSEIKYVTPVTPINPDPLLYCALNGQYYQSQAQLNTSCVANSTFFCALNGQTYQSQAQLNASCVNSVNNYEVDYDTNGGTGSPSVEYQVTLPGGAVALASQNTMIKTGYTFTGWSTSPSGNHPMLAGSAYTPPGNMVLYAVWHLSGIVPLDPLDPVVPVGPIINNKIKVTYPYQDLKFYSELAVNSNVVISYTYEACLPGGYFCKTLVGQSSITNGNSYSSIITSSDPDNKEVSFISINNITPASDSKYIYMCDKTSDASICNFSSTYTINYSPNGADSGTASTVSQDVGIGSSVALATQNSLVRYGYTFGGWSTSQSGTNPLSPGASYIPSTSITLYAVWKN